MDRRQTRMDRATRTRWPGTFAPMRLFLLLVPLGMVLGAAIASADPGDTGPFRRTTPRASLDRDAGGIVVGIPAGRAWGIESGLTPLDGVTTLRLDLAVDDPDVAEAFVRVAYYARGDARSRQLATQDSPFVRVGEDRRIVIDLSPPPGAVARGAGELFAASGAGRTRRNRRRGARASGRAAGRTSRRAVPCPSRDR